MYHKYGFAGFCGSVDHSTYSDILAFHIQSHNHKFQTIVLIIQISFNDTTSRAQIKFE